MNIQEGAQFNPMHYLKIFFRRKWFIIIPIIIGMIAGIVAGNLMPKSYESYTLILVEEEKIINPIISGLAISTSASQRLSTLRERIMGWFSLVKLTEKMNLAAGIKNQQEFENLILNKLRKNIGVQMKGSNFVRISFRGENPEMTQQIVKNITDIFIEQNVESQNKESDVAIVFLTEQLKIYQRKIKESEIASIEDQIKTLLMDSTEEHPMVKDLRSKLIKLQEDMDNSEFRPDYKISSNPMYVKLKEDLQKDIENMQTDIASGSTAKDSSAKINLADSLYKAVLVDKLDDVMARDVKINEAIYGMLLQRLETAKITRSLEASKEGTRYTVIDPPRIPLKPIKPNKFMIFMMAVFMGGAGGVGLVLLMEFTDASFLGVDEAKAFLEYPILGAISKIVTEDDFGRIKSRRTATMGISIAASLSVIFIVLVYSLIHR